MQTNIEIKSIPKIWLAGILQIGEPETIQKKFDKLFLWATKKGIINSNPIKAITIYHDHPEITETKNLRISACITIDKEMKEEGEIMGLSIEEGFYTVGRFELHPGSVFKHAWDLMIEWVEQNNCTFREGEYFEMYHNDPETHPSGKIITDICIPIEPTDDLRNAVKPFDMSQIFTADKTLDLNYYMKFYKEQIDLGRIQKAYQGLMNFIMDLRNYLLKKYGNDYIIGNISKGYMDYTYFPIVPIRIRHLKLKFAIVFIHQEMRFGISLGGKNRQIQRQYWSIFKGSDFIKYKIPETPDENFTIMYEILAENPDFSDLIMLTRQIESKAMEFIDELTDILEYK